MTSVILPSSPGTVTITNGSATIAGTGTQFTNYRTGYRLTLPNGLSVVLAADPASDTSATIALAWTGTTVTDSAFAVTAREVGSDVALQQRTLNQHLRASDVTGVPNAWKFASSTAETDPGEGFLRFNNATLASVTEIYISDIDARGADLGAWLATLTDGQMQFRSADRPSQFATFTITAQTDNTGWRTLAVTRDAGSAAYVIDENLVVNGSKAGATGPLGVPVGHRLTFSSSVTDGDPSSGGLRANNATFALITKLWIDNIDADAIAITAWLDDMDDVTNANARGYLSFQGQYDPSIKMDFAVTGAVTDKTGYREVNVSSISGALPADGAVLVAGFAKSGADGDGTGDVVGPATVIADRIAVFNGTTGKLIEDGGKTVAELLATASRKNLFHNGIFRTFQRGTNYTSATVPANNDGNYLIDGVVLLSDGNNIVDVAREPLGDPVGAVYVLSMQIKTINKKFGVFLPIETLECWEAIGGDATLSFQAKVSSVTKLDNLKAAIVSWSGTADAPTKDIVSAWGAEGTNPTLATNWTYENTPANLNPTTSFQAFKITAAIDTASAKNIGIFIWSDVTDTTVDHLLYITRVKLEAGTMATPFVPEPLAVERARCQRYLYRRSAVSATDILGMLTAVSTSLIFGGPFVTFPVPMRAVPAVTRSDIAHLGTYAAAGSGPSNLASGTFQATERGVSSLTGLSVSGSPMSVGQGAMLIFSNSSGWIEATAEIGV